VHWLNRNISPSVGELMQEKTRKNAATSWPIALILAVIASILLIVLFGYSSYDVDGFRLGLGVSPSLNGKTELCIPPFGEITASTHKTPVKLRVVLERIYPNEISQVAIGVNDQKELVRKVEAEAKKAIKQFIFRLLVLAAVGGAAGAAISPRKRGYKVLAGALVGVICAGTIIAGTYISYDVYAFKQPRYSGALSAAPWATEALAKRLSDIKTFRKEIKDIAGNVGHFYSKIDSWHPIKKSTIKILHVSDIHNNPAAVDLIRRVVEDFDIDVIVDTGDITDFGTPLETKLIEGLSSLPIPYVYVAGNHDSSETVSLMKKMKNVIVLDGKEIDIKGIKILGFSDPSSGTYDVRADTKAIDALNKTVRKMLLGGQEGPLILAVHNPRAANGLIGKVPIILVGHTHKARLIDKGGCIIDNAGTTGAAGIRTFKTQEGVPYTLSILQIDRSQKRLVAVDSLEVVGAEQEFRLQRDLIKGKTVSETELGNVKNLEW